MHAVLPEKTADGAPWHFGIGDASPLAWLVLLGYLLSATACLLTAKDSKDQSWRPRAFWLSIGVFLLLLGINKQLDFQTLLTDLARELAKNQGWYERRRAVQLGFLVALSIAAMGAALALLLIAKGLGRGAWLALVGLSCLVGFVLLRAFTFHHVTTSGTLLAQGANAVAELSGAVCTGLGAVLARRSLRA